MTTHADRSSSLGVPTRIALGSFAVGRAAPLHALVRVARRGEPAAVADVLEEVRRSAPSLWMEITEAVVVPVPRHLPGPAHSLLTAVSGEIAAVRGWHEAHDALRRIGPAPEAKVAGIRDPEVEAATLEWRVPPHEGVIVLIDDVVRTGATLRACAVAIRAAGDLRTVVAIAVAAAVSPDADDGGDGPAVAAL